MMKRYVIKIYGIVQGVGFRPYVYQTALRYHINGFVKNCGSYVIIDCEGLKKDIKSFLIDVVKKPPVLAQIRKIDVYSLDTYSYETFKILESSTNLEHFYYVSPDIATCNKCLLDIENMDSRYYHYPFTNCTDCGPRYSIIKDLPYDRMTTTMNDFMMCDECKKEYINPLDRRFHAQPIACKDCGPSLMLYNKEGKEIKVDNIIQYTAHLINQGHIMAIKGLGGFHLCCDAKNDEAVINLRKRKQRPNKPFAIMTKDIKHVNEIAVINDFEEEILRGKEKPILLLKKKENKILSKYIAPHLDTIGVFLPYTPLHALLLKQLDYIVLTSGNNKSSPITYKNEKVIEDLKEIADYFLIHDRKIERPLEDSVSKVILNKKQNIRLGRGVIPLTIAINHDKQIVALGMDEKSGYAFSQNGLITLSQYLGDLNQMACYEGFKNSMQNTIEFYNLNIDYIVTDKNHHLISSQYGSTLGKKRLEVYHHHAHMASCMGEFGLYDDVIGVIFDGTGLGDDDSVWGGEFFVGNRKTFTRVGHLEPVLIQGREKAIKDISRTAYSYLKHFDLEYNLRIECKKEKILEKAINHNINCFKTTSMGRLFDGVSYLINLIDEVTYDGEAAIRLESIVDNHIDKRYSYSLNVNHHQFILDFKEVIEGIVDDLKNEISPSIISSKFHLTIIEMVVDGVKLISDDTGINQVVLSGGVFQNQFLLEKCFNRLVEIGFKVYFNQKIPINDNGIAFGQLIIASQLIG